MAEDSAALEVIPGVGLDRARFGESRSRHRERLGEYQSFERTPGAGVTDMYADGFVMLSYDETDCLDFVEIGGNAAVVLDRTVITGRPLGDVLADLASGGLAAEFDGDSSYVVSTAGLELFTSAPDDLSEPVEGVSLRPVSGA